MDILTDANSCHLFLIDFARNDSVVYQMSCSQLEDNITVELTDMLRFTDYVSEKEKKLRVYKRHCEGLKINSRLWSVFLAELTIMSR